MSAAGAKQQQDVTVVALIQAMEKRMVERIDDLKREMSRLADTHTDLRQASIFADYIFGPDGTYTQTVKDVKRHNKYEIVTNAVLALGGLIGGSTLFQMAKRWFVQSVVAK